MNQDLYLKRLDQFLNEAHFDLNEYKTLFYSGQRRLEMLDASARTFFHRLQHHYRVMFILSIARLLDPKKSNGKPNLSIEHMIWFAEQNDLPITGDIEELLEQARIIGKSAIEVRNRILAHNDLGFYLSDDSKAITVEFEMIEKMLVILADCVRLFHSHYSNTYMAYEQIKADRGAQSLVYCIQEAMIYRELKKKRSNHRLDNDEWQNSSWAKV